MSDMHMYDILAKLDNNKPKVLKENFNNDNALKGNPENTMRSLLSKIDEGLDANQRSVNQMPSTHVMGKEVKGKKHPASQFLVGGKEVEADEESGEEELVEAKAFEGSFEDFLGSLEEFIAYARQAIASGNWSEEDAFYEFKKDLQKYSDGITPEHMGDTPELSSASMLRKPSE